MRMKATNISLYLLTCPNDKEASAISQALLEKKLATCIKKLPISSQFRWKGTIDKAEEILMLIESTSNNFNNMESTIREHHTDETFVLFSLPVDQTTTGVL
jgi:periplasmic divalent cation tolerance protein